MQVYVTVHATVCDTWNGESYRALRASAFLSWVCEFAAKCLSASLVLRVLLRADTVVPLEWRGTELF